MSYAISLHTSSLRTQGPIITGVRGYGRSLPECQNEGARRMGPGVRRDDVEGIVRMPKRQEAIILITLPAAA